MTFIENAILVLVLGCALGSVWAFVACIDMLLRHSRSYREFTRRITDQR